MSAFSLRALLAISISYPLSPRYFFKSDAVLTQLIASNAFSFADCVRNISDTLPEISKILSPVLKFSGIYLKTFFGSSPTTFLKTSSYSFNEPPINVPIGPFGLPVLTPSRAYCLLKPFFSQCIRFLYCHAFIFSLHFFCSSGVIANALRFFQ